MSVFINEAIDNGIKNYLNLKNNQSISIVHIYEQKVIEMLVMIYGEVSIINPYQDNNEQLFKDNLLMYGITQREVYKFLRGMNSFNVWLNSVNNSKNDTINRINDIIFEMAILRNKHSKFSNIELKKLEDFFKPVNGSLYRLYHLSLNEPDYSRKLWDNKSKLYFKDSSLVFNELGPNLLSDEDYAGFGLSLDDVKKMTNVEIDEINKKILESSSTDNVGGGKNKEKPLQLVLSSGSGFADTLILFSVMTTEILIGFVIALIVYGG